MGFFKKLFGKKQSPVPTESTPDNGAPIEAFDEHGRKIYISRDQWRDNVLLGALKSQWNDPDALYGTIVDAINDGFEKDIVEATKHLFEIDYQPDRAATIWGIVLLRSGRLDDSEKVLRDFMADHGEHGFILTNLAKVYFARNDVAKAQEILWHGIEIDPNQDNGMGWYVEMQRERGGQDAYVHALKQIAAIPNSWRAQLWLAREAIGSNDIDGAIQLYNECISRVQKPVPADALMQISSDLGRAGYLEKVSELVEPHFDVDHHGLQVGNNLIKAHVDSGDFDKAAKLVEQLYRVNRPDWRETLSYWETEIAKGNLSAPSPEDVSMSFLTGEGPTWLNPKTECARLFAVDQKSGLSVCFLGSSVEVDNPHDQIEHQLADARGRLSRAIPLFLAEQIHFYSDASAQTLVPWVKNGGFVLFGEYWGDDAAATYASASDYVVTTHLKCKTEPWVLDARIIRVSDRQCIDVLSVEFAVAAPETAIPQLSKDLLKRLKQVGIEAGAGSPLYSVPSGSLFPYYLLRLEQLLAVGCSNLDEASSGSLNGERSILDGNIDLCLDQPDNVTTRLVLAETLLLMKNVRPDIVPDFKHKVDLLQRNHPLSEQAQGVVQRMLDSAFGA